VNKRFAIIFSILAIALFAVGVSELITGDVWAADGFAQDGPTATISGLVKLVAGTGALFLVALSLFKRKSQK